MNWFTKEKLNPEPPKTLKVAIEIWFTDDKSRVFDRPKETNKSNIWHFMDFFKWYHCREESSTFSFGYNKGVLCFRKSDIARFEIKEFYSND